ncbi:MAG: hypothetical protein Q8O01_02865 [Candidatus Omnitrophota bacterium]|nr:hypothetical protein [Candidatus Omnitrophota bacterium]
MRRSDRHISQNDPSRQLKESGLTLLGDYLPVQFGSFLDSMKNSRDSTAAISALHIVKSGRRCLACFLQDLNGNSSGSVFWISSDSVASKEIAVSSPLVIGGVDSAIRKNAIGSRPFLHRSKDSSGKKDHPKNGIGFLHSGINSSELSGHNMAKIINRLSLGDVGKNVVLLPCDAVRPKFYHHVKKLYHNVMLKMILPTLKGKKEIGHFVGTILQNENLETFGYTSRFSECLSIRKRMNYRPINRRLVPFLSPSIVLNKYNALKRNEI